MGMRRKNIINSEKHLPSHMGINKLKNLANEEYIGITSCDISNFISSCRNCNSKNKPEFSYKIVPIVVEDVHQLIMVNLIDFSMYSNFNSGYKYAFVLMIFLASTYLFSL
ncbi:hypothetical protein DMUE_3204 [Dictyocoela muelleri]|nr:hypothetical protein DMUE_3204 [Dictyocoela muelleri]